MGKYFVGGYVLFPTFSVTTKRSASGAAIALPLILLLLATIFAIGSTLAKTQVLETAARDAARYLSHTKLTTADETAARNIAVYSNAGGTGTRRAPGLGAGNVAISYVTIANPVNVATGERSYRGTDPIKLVRINIAWTSTANGLWGFFGASPVTYHAINQQRVIGD